MSGQTGGDVGSRVERGRAFERDLGDLTGRAWKVGDGISTDHIAPGRYFDLRSDLDALAEHTLEDASLETTDRPFMEVTEPGDFVVGGGNFGQGSSREHAPAVIERIGVSAVLARSVARIFYRNAINVGLPVIQCDTSFVDEGDELHVDLQEGVVVDRTKGLEIEVDPLPSVMMRILLDGGLTSHVEEHGSLDLE